MGGKEKAKSEEGEGEEECALGGEEEPQATLRADRQYISQIVNHAFVLPASPRPPVLGVSVESLPTRQPTGCRGKGRYLFGSFF